MSYTTLYKVPEEGPIEEYETFRNSFRGAAMLWDWLGRLHVPMFSQAIFPMADQKLMDRLFRLVGYYDIPLHRRIVLATTYDNAMVRRVDFFAVAEAMELVATEMTARVGVPPDPPKVEQDSGTYPQQAEALRRLHDDEDAFAACWCQTSAADDVWERWDDGCDDPRPYDLSKDDDHCWVLKEFGLTEAMTKSFEEAAIAAGLEPEDVARITAAVTGALTRAGTSALEDATFGSLTRVAVDGVMRTLELRQYLAEAIPGAHQILATGLGVSNADLASMLDLGKVSASDALLALAEID